MFVATGTEIDDLQGTLTSGPQQDVLGLQVAMDDSLAFQHAQAVQQGGAELTYQGHSESLEVVLLDQLIKVHPEHKKRG